jgi:hypothetical protein
MLVISTTVGAVPTGGRGAVVAVGSLVVDAAFVAGFEPPQPVIRSATPRAPTDHRTP